MPKDKDDTTHEERHNDRTNVVHNERDDPNNPFNWKLRVKWTVTLSTCFVCFLVGLNATGIASAPTPINHRFHVSDASFPNSFWPVASWTVGAAIVPMIILPLMEEYGVRPGYLLCYAIFLILVVPQAVARNFATLVASRFFAGGAAGVLQNGMDGIIADVWPGAVQRSLPVTIYVTGLLMGVSLGPVFGGVVIRYLYWRWILYIQLIMYAIIFLPLLFVMKETRLNVILTRRRRSLEARKHMSPEQSGLSKRRTVHLKAFLYETLLLPAKLLCTEPVVFFFTLLSALSYGVVFISTQSVTQVFVENYGFREYQAGLVQASVAIGEGLGFFACLLQNAWYARAVRLNSGKSEADLSEVRLYASIPASFLMLTGGLFWYGWTSYPFLPWVLPAIGLALVGFGVTVVMQAIMMYVTDAYARYAASASAAVCFGENVFAAFLPLAAQSMYTNLGFQWASSLLGFVALLFSLAPVVLVIKGIQIRARSPFMAKAAFE